MKFVILARRIEKRITLTAYRAEYERNNARMRSKQGKYYKKKRSSTVEPVFGVLTQYLGMRKVNTKGLAQANKVMHMAAIAYNIKKYLKFMDKKVQSGIQEVGKMVRVFSASHHFILAILRPLHLNSTHIVFNLKTP